MKELEIKITEENVKDKLDKLTREYLDCPFHCKDKKYEIPNENYKSVEQYSASRILNAIDALIRYYSDPGNYLSITKDNRGFPEELEPLVLGHYKKIMEMRPIGFDRAKEIKEKEKLNSELKKYLLIYVKIFDKMKIPKKYWWDEICA